MKEEWKIFKISFKGQKNQVIYEVSTLGRIKANGILVEPIKRDYLYWQKGYRNSARIHRIVAETFIPNPNNLPCVDHIDGNKYNNSVENLRWVTYTENSNNPNTKPKLSNSLKEYYSSHEPWNKGKKMDEEFCNKVSQSLKGSIPWNKGKKGVQISWNKGKEVPQLKGEKNGMYGVHTIFINKDNINKRIHKEDLEKFLNEGWNKGVVRKK